MHLAINGKLLRDHRQVSDYNQDMKAFSTVILTDMGWTLPLIPAKIFAFAGVPIMFELINGNHWRIFSSLYDPAELVEKQADLIMW